MSKPPTEYKVHPAAEVFPPITNGQLRELVDDIARHGLLRPITVYQGMVLDGRHRLLACDRAGVEPRFEEYTGSDPIAFVISLNLRHRHLDESQRAMAASRLAELRETIMEHDNKGKFAPTVRLGAQQEAAATLNVSERSVKSATKVRKKATPELAAAVDRGEIPVSTAAALADKPKAVQRKAAKGGKKVARKLAEAGSGPATCGDCGKVFDFGDCIHCLSCGAHGSDDRACAQCGRPPGAPPLREKDGLGRPIAPEIAAEYDRVDALLGGIVADAMALQKKLTALLEDRIADFHSQTMIDYLKQIGSAARAARPHTTCVYCKLVPKKRTDCTHCFGRGFIGKASLDRATEPLRFVGPDAVIYYPGKNGKEELTRVADLLPRA